MTSQFRWQVSIIAVICCASWIQTAKSPLKRRDEFSATSYSNFHMEQMDNYNNRGPNTFNPPLEESLRYREDGPMREHYFSFSHYPHKDMHEMSSDERNSHHRPEAFENGVKERKRNEGQGQQNHQAANFYPIEGKSNKFHEVQGPRNTNEQRHNVDDVHMRTMSQSQGQREEHRIIYPEEKRKFVPLQNDNQFPSFNNNEKYPIAFPNGNEGHHNMYVHNETSNKQFLPSEPYREFIEEHFHHGANENRNNQLRGPAISLNVDQNFKTYNGGASSFNHPGDIPESQFNNAKHFGENYAHFRGNIPKEPPNRIKNFHHTKDSSRSPNIDNEKSILQNQQKINPNTDKRFPYRQDPTIIFRPVDNENNKQFQWRPKNNNHGPVDTDNFRAMAHPMQQTEIPIYIPGSGGNEFRNDENPKQGRRPFSDSIHTPYFQTTGIPRDNYDLGGFRYDNIGSSLSDFPLKKHPVLHTLREKPFFESSSQSADMQQLSPYYYRNGNVQIGFGENGFKSEGFQFVLPSRQKDSEMSNEQKSRVKEQFSGNYKYGSLSSTEDNQKHFLPTQVDSLLNQMTDPENQKHLQSNFDNFRQSAHRAPSHKFHSQKDEKIFRDINDLHKSAGNVYKTNDFQQFNYHMTGGPKPNVPMEFRRPKMHTFESLVGGVRHQNYFNDVLEQEMPMHIPQRSSYNNPPPQQYSYMSPSDSTNVLTRLLPIGIIGTLGIAGLKLGLLKALFLSSLLKSKQNNISYANYGTHYDDGFEKIISSLGNHQNEWEESARYNSPKSQIQYQRESMPYQDLWIPMKNLQSNLRDLSRNIPQNYNNPEIYFPYASYAQSQSQYTDHHNKEESNAPLIKYPLI